MAIDPVCGMEVEPHTAAENAAFKGKTYYFCSSSCAEVFEQDPERYGGLDARPGEKTHSPHS